jgi:hypothetical protein
MLSHDITEFYEVLNVYGALIPIYHCQGKFSIVTREHQGERICFKTYKVCFKTYKRVSTEKKGGAQRVKDTAMRHLQDPN